MSTTDHESGLEASPELLGCLSNVYHERLNNILHSLCGMGTRYYVRLNTLTGPAEETLQEMTSDRFEIFRHETLDDAAYLPTKKTTIQSGIASVEADRFAAEAVLQGAHLYAPGVKKCQGVKTGQFVSVNGPNSILVGSGETLQDETSILTHRQGIAVKVSNSKFGLPSLMETSWYLKGRIHLQSLPAMVTCHVLDPKPEETILDLNCAPGGKMSYLCQLTKNQAKIIGFDRSKRKIERTKKNLDRLKCDNYALILHDSRYAHVDYNFKADRVLVDPSCTALGVTPKLTIGKDFRDIANLSTYQRQFLKAAASLVKPGGVVVYSVCTVSLEECEDTVSFAEHELGLEQVEATPKIGRDGLDPGHMSQRFDPELDGSGYFIAKFVKT
jgi:16S rRNA (cytosine967-C5)-methyltransferase